jgi:hypothetical protein
MKITVLQHPGGIVEMRVAFPSGAVLSLFFENADRFHEFVMGALKCDRELSPQRFPEAGWGGELSKFILEVLE